MKKVIYNFILLILITFISLTIILSTTGIKTKRFNNIIEKKINHFNNSINLKLTTIKFKLDLKELSLFLEAINPKIYYRNSVIPAKNIKAYIDFISLVKSKPKLKKINLTSSQFDTEQLKNISSNFKPSNFTSFIHNRIKQGKINIELEIFLDDKNLFDNFIARGSVLNLKTEIKNNINLQKTNFNFFADKNDILIKNIVGESGPIKIKDGDLKIKLNSNISLESNFLTNLRYNDKFKNYQDLIKSSELAKNITNIEIDLNNSFFIIFDKTYKVKEFNYKSNGKIKKADLEFKKPFENSLLEEQIKQFSIINSEIQTNFSPKKNTINIFGKYSLNKGNYLSFNLKNASKKEILKLKLNADYDRLIKLDFINYQKPKNLISNFSINLEKQKDNIKIEKLNFVEGKNSFKINDLNFYNNKFLSLKKISVKTTKDKKTNNDFLILYGKKIKIDGNLIDATNLPKIIKQKNSNNLFSQISRDIEIDFTNIIAPLSENIKNFKLIGKLEKGKFTKISAKGDFGENNFLDINLKKDRLTKKKYLEIYSDLTRPLLTEYSFFKGLTGGKLLFSSVIDEKVSISKLQIENFKVINAPGMVKLLSLADLGGLADLAEGEGLSFDILEIKMEKNKNFLKINEILALGPSISVLMEGYQNSTVTSLRGTLVPARTLNKMISKIPVLGDIIIPKEAGEGLFGISFKIKGPAGDIKTSINPIRTITPRFIQKIIDRNKLSK
jgi:hypothetical protein